MIATFRLYLTLRAPWLSRDNRVGLLGIDAPLARLPDGRFHLPGTLLVGRLAEAFDHLSAADPTFGTLRSAFFAANSESDESAKGQEARRRIFISDLVLEQNSWGGGVRTRIAIDAATGTAAEGALQMIEAPLPPGEAAHFNGKIRLLGTPEEIASFAPQLEKAIAWLTQLGGGRTYGHGVISRFDFQRELSATPPQPIEGCTRLQLRIAAHDPLCVGEKRTSPNSYQSSAVIAGGVIKGALARTILCGQPGTLSEEADDSCRFATITKCYSSLRISHAFPVSNQSPFGRPRRFGFSIAHHSDHGFADMAMLKNPDAAFAGWEFEPDWKDSVATELCRRLSWSEPEHDFRIRTAIDKTHRASDEGRLFAISYCRPDTHDWVAHVDVSPAAADARGALLKELQAALAEGLAGVGRGGAFCTIAIEPLAEDEPLEAQTGDRLIVTLQTPALLRRPDEGGGDVTDAYREAFAEIGLAGLQSIFVRERLHGAQFFANRLPDRTKYRPWLLTRAGSVFVFEVEEDVRLDQLRATARWGLEIPTATAEFYGLDLSAAAWKYCPYLPENGYGEVHLRVVKPEQLHERPVLLEEGA